MVAADELRDGRMKLLKYLLVVVFLTAFAACGGGGGNSASVPVVPTVPVAETPSTIEVLNTSGSSLLSAGSEATISAYVKNSANVGLAKQKVTFSATSGALQVASSETNDTGVITAKLTAGSDKSTREITVTVTAGTVSSSIIVPVTGTSLSIAGSGSLQAGGAAAQYTVRAVDSSNTPIRDARITVRSSLGNTVSTASLTTDGTGSASFLYTPNVAGTDNLTVTGLGTTASSAIVITAVDFVVVSPASNTTVDIGSSQAIRVRYRLSGVGVNNQTVAFSTTRGLLSASSATTDVNGEALVNVSSSTAGPGVVVAQIAGVGQINLPLLFVATTPSTISVQANPGAILPNSSGSSNQSTIEAVVRDASGNVVAGRQVNFTALTDLSNGSLNPAVATTDANGRAQVQFISGANSTPSDGVVIQGQVASTGITGTTKLTVNGKALFITIGYGNTISNLDETTYSKLFTVYVTDANGVAVGNQVITISVVPEVYLKGSLSYNGVVWDYSGVPTQCLNEDRNGNGILDSGEDNDALNGNNDGRLTPGNVVVAAPGTVTTDAAGRTTFNLQYGEQYVPWVRVAIKAYASVAGTESRQSVSLVLPGLSSDFSKADNPPAGVRSPFGTQTLCTNPN